MKHFRTRFQRFIFLRVLYLYADDRSFKKQVFEKWKKRTIFQGDAPSPVFQKDEHIVMNKKLASYFRRKLIVQSNAAMAKQIHTLPKSEPELIQSHSETFITQRSQSLTEQKIIENIEEITEQQKPEPKQRNTFRCLPYSIVLALIILFLWVMILKMFSNQKNLE